MTSRALDRTAGLNLRARAFSLVDEVVDEMRRSGAFQQPPVPLEDIAGRFGVAKIVRRDIGYSGRLVRVGSRFVVELQASEHPVRQRFTLAHELGHLVVAEVGAPLGGRPLLQCKRDKYVERLCDEIGGRFLMPSPELGRVLGGRSLTVVSLMEVARRFRVSLRAAAIRLVDFFGTHCAVLWRYGRRAGSDRTAFRVEWSATPPGVFVPRKDGCTPDCIVEACAAADEVKSGRLRLDLGSLRGTYEVEVMPIRGGYGGGSDVLMIVDNATREGSVARKEAVVE